jgi:hypothetical protein
VLRFQVPVSLATLPPEKVNQPVTIEAENITLRDALRLAAAAAGVELSVSAKSFHFHLPGKRPKGTQAVGEASTGSGRAATEEEIAAAGMMVEVHQAEVTAEQFKTLSIAKGMSPANFSSLFAAPKGAADAKPAGPAEAARVWGAYIAALKEGASVLAELKAAEIPISSPPAFNAREHLESNIRVFEHAQPDGAKEYLDLEIKSQFAPQGTVELEIAPQWGRAKDGKETFSTRRIQTSAVIESGSTMVAIQRSPLAEGKVSLIFIKATNR